MNKNRKRELYESIMKDVSKTIKRKINENVEDFEAEELLNTLTDDDVFYIMHHHLLMYKDDDVFYIMHDETARKLRNQVTDRGQCFTIDGMVVFVPSIDDQYFYVQLNEQLIKMGDYNFFTVATCASDGDDLIGNIRMYCNDLL